MKMKAVLWIGGLLLLVGIGGLGAWLFWDLPSPEDLSAYTTAPSSKIYDRYGRLLFEMPPPYTGSHTPVPLNTIPQSLLWATIATEDATFYENPGMDMYAILRAIWINLQGGEVLAGGSTLTQQLVRTVMFSPKAYLERTLRRKLRELVLAVRITRRYTKEEILALYLNETYYGNMAYGVEAAAQAYFGKPVRDLDLAECAMLAGLPQAPALYNPLEDLAAARKRQAIVLELMVKQGYIDGAQAELAKKEALAFAASPFPIRAPHFVMYVRGELERRVGLARLQAGGLHIYTTLDVDLNETVRDLMRHRLALLAKCNYEDECPPGGYNVRNAAVVVLNPQTGEILAMVGSPDYFSARIDGAVNGTTALRQPGSSIKPITYAAAFAERTFTPASMLLDVRTAFVTREGTPYVPLNYDLDFRGPVRLREALASSYNLIAVKVLDAIGVETMVTLARRMGITTFDDPERIGLSITLGGGEVRLLELASAYAAFANGGHRAESWGLRYVEDEAGQQIWTHPCLRNSPEVRPRALSTCLGARVLDARVAYLISDVLSDDMARVPTFGEESVLNVSHPAAVKTGTTTDFRDNWTLGYTPQLVVGVWVGNADNEVMQHVSGITGAAPLWHDVMEAALQGMPVRAFTPPEGLVQAEVCALSGLRPNPDCPHRVTEWFLAGTAPGEFCDIHQRIGDTVYLNLPPEAQAWARAHNIPPPPAVPSTTEPTLILTSPDEGAVYRIDPALPLSEQKLRIAAEVQGAFEHVSFWVDGVLFARVAQLPYAVLWPLQVGEHRFSAVAITAEGAEMSSHPVVIHVQK